MSSLNKVMIIGNLGSDPDIRSMTSGDEIANLSVATSEIWTDKASGEKKSRSQWHKVVVFNPALVKVAKNYLTKGSKIYIEGQLETRKWADKDGKDQYSTEIVLRPFNGQIVMLDNKKTGQAESRDDNSMTGNMPSARQDEMADDIPFN